MVEERAASFTKRSIKTSAKLSGLKMVISMMDLTTLEGKDTPGKVAYLCRKALQPADPKYGAPPCGAVCVYPNMVRYARRFLGVGSPVKVASVATGFPSGQYPLRTRLEEELAVISHWNYDAYFLAAESMKGSNKAKAIEFYKKFKDTAPKDSPYIAEADKALAALEPGRR